MKKEINPNPIFAQKMNIESKIKEVETLLRELLAQPKCGNGETITDLQCLIADAITETNQLLLTLTMIRRETPFKAE